MAKPVILNSWERVKLSSPGIFAWGCKPKDFCFAKTACQNIADAEAMLQ